MGEHCCTAAALRNAAGLDNPPGVQLYFFPQRDLKIVMVGLDNAGKTTVLYKLHLGEAVSVTPTVGSNVEQIQFRNLTLTVWDLGASAWLKGSALVSVRHREACCRWPGQPETILVELLHRRSRVHRRGRQVSCLCGCCTEVCLPA